MRRLGFAENEVRFVTALVGADPVGFAIKTGNVNDAFEQTVSMAAQAGIGMEDFFKYSTAYYSADAYSYDSLKYLFAVQNGGLRVAEDVPSFHALSRMVGVAGNWKAVDVVTRGKAVNPIQSSLVALVGVGIGHRRPVLPPWSRASSISSCSLQR